MYYFHYILDWRTVLSCQNLYWSKIKQYVICIFSHLHVSIETEYTNLKMVNNINVNLNTHTLKNDHGLTLYISYSTPKYVEEIETYINK